jgi:lipoprotein-releasing system permease protein
VCSSDLYLQLVICYKIVNISQFIFISISLSIGIGGALAGALLGLFFCFLIDNIPFSSPAIPTLKTYPVDYGIQYYAIAVLFAVATTYFAGWFPARKASSVDPVEIIRGK